MQNNTWLGVDEYLEDLFGLGDAEAEAAFESSKGLPNISVSPIYGMTLNLMAQACSASSILEIGTLGGYSTIWLARALPEDGRLISLELNEVHAQIARANIERAGLAGKVEVRVAPALESLATLAEEGAHFDLIFIDADKPSYTEYLRWSLQMSRPGTLIIADNVVRQGKIADGSSEDTNVRAAREFLAALAATPNLKTTVLQTVGRKGYDGFSLSVVQE